MRRFIKQRYKTIASVVNDAGAVLVIAAVVGGVYFFLQQDGSKGLENQEQNPTGQSTTTQTNVVKPQSANLAFDQTGRVVSVPVKKGQRVSAGATIAQMDSSEQKQNLLTAQARLKVEEATLATLRANIAGAEKGGYTFDQTKKQQDILVANAYSKLLSEGLVVAPSQDNYDQTVPTISGRYSGEAGRYKIIIYRGARYTQILMRVFGLEQLRDIELDEIAATPLATKGLFITFADDLEDYVDTVWYLDLPNTKSSVYLANYNAYVSAKETRDVALTAAGATEEAVAAQIARVEQAEIAVEVANIQLQKRTLKAPFSGVITDLYITAGEVAVATVKVAVITAE